MILGMDWLYLHRNKVEFYEKDIKFLDENGEHRILQGKKQPTLVRMVTSIQEKHSYRKGCVMFVVHIYIDKGNDVEDAEVSRKYPIFQQFSDVFPADISKLLPHREVEFSIELMSGTTLASKAPYNMIILELV